MFCVHSKNESADTNQIQPKYGPDSINFLCCKLNNAKSGQNNKLIDNVLSNTLLFQLVNWPK